MQESDSASSNNDGSHSGERNSSNWQFEQKSLKKTKAKNKSKAVKVAGILSSVLWIIGFILPFVLSPKSPYVWVSDTFLLIGFWPLLFVYRAGWTWLVFGLMNMVIGFFLEFNKQLPPYLESSSFWTAERLALKPQFMQIQQHIADMHPCMPWLLIGAASTIYGVFRITKTIVCWIIKLIKKNR